MSHHTHVFLCNEEDAEACMSWVNSNLDEGMLRSNWVDSCDIIGALNLSTGEYTPNKYAVFTYDNEPNTIKKLEVWANSLYGKEMYDCLLEQLQKYIKQGHFWQAADICYELDGIEHPVKKGWKWTAKEPFSIKDGYLRWNGITDWMSMCAIPDAYTGKQQCDNQIYAVLVDFHS